MNVLLGIHSWVPFKFTNLGSGSSIVDKIVENCAAVFFQETPTEPTAVKTWRWASANVYE
jgi:hypothetical protein